MFAERLKAGSLQCANFCMHLLPIEQQMLQQQLKASLFHPWGWKVNRTSVKPWETSAGNVVWGVEMETSGQHEKKFQAENVRCPPTTSTDNRSVGQRGCEKNCTHLQQHGLCDTLGRVFMGVHRWRRSETKGLYTRDRADLWRGGSGRKTRQTGCCWCQT